MAKIEQFEEIIAWQKARELTVMIYRDFRDNRDFSLRDQIQRASNSVMANIAEGFERKSNKEFIQFLYIAKGSVGEVRSFVYTALDLGYITQSEFDDVHKKCVEISRLLSGFIKSL